MTPTEASADLAAENARLRRALRDGADRVHVPDLIARAEAAEAENARLRKLHDGMNASLQFCFGKETAAMLARVIASDARAEAAEAREAKYIDIADRLDLVSDKPEDIPALLADWIEAHQSSHQHYVERAKAAEVALSQSPGKEVVEDAGSHRNVAWWTYDKEASAYYFAPSTRRPPPYRKQQQTTAAILDIADDETLAGIELLFGSLPAPPSDGEERKP